MNGLHVILVDERESARAPLGCFRVVRHPEIAATSIDAYPLRFSL
jgi:hypothetical protein